MTTPGNVDKVLITTTTNPLVGTFTQGAIFTAASVCNTSNTNRTVTAYRNSATTTNNEMIPALVVPPGTTVLPLAGQTLPAGVGLYMKCDVAGKVNANIAFVFI